MKKRILNLLIAIILALSVLPLAVSRTSAANLSTMSDVQSRLLASYASNHTITFTLGGTTTFEATETIVLNFDDTFDTSALAITDPLDYDIKVGATEEAIVANGGCASTDAIEITSINASTETITFTACASYTAGAAGAVIEIEIGTNATSPSAGNSQIVNGTATSKILAITAAGDTGSVAQAIMSADQVTVSGTVDPTISSTLSGATCNLGALAATVVNSCSYTNHITTNAGSGYYSTIVEDGNLRSGTPTISDVADGTVDTSGDEEYGASTSSTNLGAQDILVWDGTCEASGDISELASPITGTAKRYSDHDGPVDETTTICHSATIATTTEAGSYSHIVTHITTGSF